MIQNFKVHYKCSDLCLIIKEHFGKDMNWARIKAMSMMICSLCKEQRVAYTKHVLASIVVPVRTSIFSHSVSSTMEWPSRL